MIEIRNLTASYGRKEVLSDISLTLENGSLTSIVGPNGSGKSTLLKCISNLEKIYTGDILVDGINTGTMSSRELARHVSYLAQSRNVPDISAGRMVLHGRFPYLSYPRSYRKEDFEIAEEAMQKVDALQYRDLPVSTLSGGQRQKVYIAMSLAQETENILLDEPTTYLDIHIQHELMKTMSRMKDEGRAVVMVIHDLISALKYSQKIIVLDEGRVVISGTPDEIFESGVLDKIFETKLNRAMIEGVWQYFYE